MDDIIDSFVSAGYYRARISNLSDFDKIIGGMAWAMQLFCDDINIDVFYADSLDLGQKIALTERLVMVLIALKCPYRVEPHQIVGLDFTNLLPAIRWLLKRSDEIRRELAAFYKILALRYYYKVTNGLSDRSCSSEALNGNQLNGGDGSHDGTAIVGLVDEDVQSMKDRDINERRRTAELLASISENFKDNKQVSFVKLASALSTSTQAAGDYLASALPSSPQQQQVQQQQLELQEENLGAEDEDDDNDDDDCHIESTCFTDDDAKTTISDDSADSLRRQAAMDESEPSASAGASENQGQSAELSEQDRELHGELDLELLATNQKILSLLKKLDLMPNELEICQYQRRYVELHQQLISGNRDVKKLFDLYNSLDVEKHYLERELNLLDSIGDNLHLTNESAGNRDLFMTQLGVIITKIQSIRDDMEAQVCSLRRKCDSLNEEHVKLMNAGEL